MGVDLHSGADLLAGGYTSGQFSISQHPPTGNSSLCSQDSGVNTDPFIRFISSWGVETKYSVPGANRFAAY